MNQAHCPLGWTVFEGMLDGSFQCYDTVSSPAVSEAAAGGRVPDLIKAL
jgi:hypothetical protein